MYCLYGNSLGKIELDSLDVFSTPISNVFANPTGLVIDKTNNIAYISDSGNGLIKKVYLSVDDTSVSNVEIATGGYQPKGSITLSLDNSRAMFIDQQHNRLVAIAFTCNGFIEGYTQTLVKVHLRIFRALNLTLSFSSISV